MCFTLKRVKKLKLNMPILMCWGYIDRNILGLLAFSRKKISCLICCLTPERKRKTKQTYAQFSDQLDVTSLMKEKSNGLKKCSTNSKIRT